MQDSNECAAILESFHNFDDLYFAVLCFVNSRHEFLAAATGYPILIKTSRSGWHKKGTINFKGTRREGRSAIFLAFMKHYFFLRSAICPISSSYNNWVACVKRCTRLPSKKGLVAFG